MTVRHARVLFLAAGLVGISALIPSSALAAESTTVVEQQSTATEVFDKNSPAIVTIQTPSGFGSGVLVDSSGVIVTNLHVVEGDSSATVTLANGDIYDDVQVIAVDERRDIVVIKIAGFQLPSVELGDSDEVAVGQTVYAIGSPQGLALTISDGIISGERPSPGDEGSRILQTTAAISPGSSGGGLFDEGGRLIGVTTFRVTGGESLNFAVPINYVRGMVATAPQWSLAEFNSIQGVSAAQPGRIPTTEEDSIDDIRRAADQGDAVAQYNLGVRYRQGQGVSFDFAEAIRWWRAAAEQGLNVAQYNLGVMFWDGRRVPPDAVEAIRWFRLAADPPVPIICETTSLVRLV